VTTPNYDDIGAVLKMMAVSHSAFGGNYDCDLLFLNCGTPDRLDARSVRRFVEAGGCLYASDLTSAFISQTFPGLFNFAGTGMPGTLDAIVVDPELRAIVGQTTRVHFDMSDWSILRSCRGDTLVVGAPSCVYGDIPLMVCVEVGSGAVFYTSFHNRAQASEQEKVLLQLLVLKQIGARSNLSMEQASKQVGLSLTSLRAKLDGP
jgi:hypothetical protein